MTDPKAPKTTSAQRQAALRQRARSLAYGLDDDDIRTAPDTALLEALPIAYRARQTAPIEGIVVELLHRLGRHVKIIPVEPPDVTVTRRGYPPADPPVSSVTVTTTPEPTPEPKSRRSYPIEVQRMAVGMADAGITSREIVDAIKAMVGRAPAVSNVQKLLKGWRAALD
ncbi:hypothetical protein [Thiocapsa marina]|uniref:Uncharacterized protein n=1 Tax=Thiocapsa marina 5811 TaxID=768671 RepID=F9UA85_9GAMM|nr:hypothetical protein [Thiocapsa marina]EGV19033.1 hypothetical protein ThimaDRAFT_1837 [Thiocapsa marina 5811]